MHSDAVLEPYNVRLGTNCPAVPPVHEWAVKVRGQLEVELTGVESLTLIALAGRQYRTALESVPWQVEVPMQGMGIGRQVAWVTRKLTR